MPLLIQTTGLEQYAPGGAARVKVLMIGGPGVGKTRWASYFPRPIYADCEKGLASVADRSVPYVQIKNSDDMLALLAMLKQECQLPASQRRFDTVVIDTLDAFQRKLKNEWMEKERKQVFTGWEAWGFVGSKMQMLMTRLLNLDMNVVVNCHYKDKVTSDTETGRETHELMLQLQGEAADTAFNDFDLCGWMGTYFEAANGERVQKRGITFTPTPDKPFLKDRLYATPKWLEVSFDESDYKNLFARIEERISEMGSGEVVGEVPTEQAEPASGFVVPPGQLPSVPMPAQSPRPVPYAQMDRITLAKAARDRGITQTVDGAPLKGNTIKGELIAALEAADAKGTATAAPSPAPARPAAATGPGPEPAKAAPVAPAAQGKESDAPQVALARHVANQQRVKAPAPAPAPAPDPAPVPAPAQKAPIDVSHLQVLPDEPDEQQAIETAQEVLGAQVVAQSAPEPKPEPKPDPDPAPAQPSAACEECGKDLAGENPDFVKLSWIKYRKKLCAEHYQAMKR